MPSDAPRSPACQVKHASTCAGTLSAHGCIGTPVTGSCANPHEPDLIDPDRNDVRVGNGSPVTWCRSSGEVATRDDLCERQKQMTSRGARRRSPGVSRMGAWILAGSRFWGSWRMEPPPEGAPVMSRRGTPRTPFQPLPATAGRQCQPVRILARLLSENTALSECVRVQAVQVEGMTADIHRVVLSLPATEFLGDIWSGATTS